MTGLTAAAAKSERLRGRKYPPKRRRGGEGPAPSSDLFWDSAVIHRE